MSDNTGFSEITDPAVLRPGAPPAESAFPRDHNKPPLDELLNIEMQPFIARKDDLLAGVARMPAAITDADVCERAADVVKLLAGCWRNAEASRTSTKEPFLAAGRLVDSRYKKEVLDPLDTAKKQVEAKMTVYQRHVAEQERLVRVAEAKRQADEAERQRREVERLRVEALAKAKEAEDALAAAQTEDDIDAAIALETQAAEIAESSTSVVARAEQTEADLAIAQRAAIAKPAELSRVRGNIGAVASLRTFWDFDGLDRNTLDLEALRQHLPVDALEKAVRAFVKAGGRKLKGVHIFENTGTRVV